MDGYRMHDYLLVGRPDPEAPPPAVELCMAAPDVTDKGTWWNSDSGLAPSVNWPGVDLRHCPHNASPWVADPMTRRRPIADHMSHRHRTILGAHVSNDAMSKEHLAPMCEIVEAARTQQNFVREMLDGVVSDIRDNRTGWSGWPREGAKRAANLAGAVVRNVAHPDGVVTSNVQGIVLVTPDGLQSRARWDSLVLNSKNSGKCSSLARRGTKSSSLICLALKSSSPAGNIEMRRLP